VSNGKRTTAARRVKPARPVEARFLDTPFPDGRQLLLVRAGGKDFYYLAGRILGEDGNLLGYRLTKSDGSSYDIDLTGERPTCECAGHLRWGVECKHIQAVRLASVALPTAEEDGGYKPDSQHGIAF
jgi:hypothetical protein